MKSNRLPRKFAMLTALILTAASHTALMANENHYVSAETDSQKNSEIGIMVMAHGGGENWNANVEKVVAPLKSSYPIEIAFGMARPSTMQEAVDRLTAKGVSKIVVVRMFISGTSFLKSTEYILGLRDENPFASMSMMHGSDSSLSKPMKNTMKSTMKKDSAESRSGGMKMEPLRQITTKASFVINPNGVGSSILVDDILIDRVTTLSENPKNETVLILAHGPGDDLENERWLANMKDRAKALNKIGKFKAVLCETLREDWPEKRAVAEDRLKQIVIDGSKDGNKVIVIPFRIAGFGPYKTVLEGLDYVADERPFCPHENLTRWIKTTADESIIAIDTH